MDIELLGGKVRAHISRRVCWVRMCGLGLKIASARGPMGVGPLFSDREALRAGRAAVVGPVLFRML
jgi:hypothetical protein